MASGGVVAKTTGGKQRPTKRQRASPAVTHVQPDQQLRETLARELLGVCMATLRTYGLRGKQLAALAASAVEGSEHIGNATAVLAEAQRLADTTNKWVEDPAYRDATGRPAVLSIREGAGCSFAALAREFFPRQPVADVVTLACKANVLERVGRDKVALLNSTVLFTGNSLPILAYSIRTVRRFLSTAEFNRRAKSAVNDGCPDRTSFVEVSEEDFQEFVRMIRPQISGLIEMSNRWMFQRSQLSRNRLKKKRVAGIQVFIFRD
jgi:hypothetical protein